MWDHQNSHFGKKTKRQAAIDRLAVGEPMPDRSMLVTDWARQEPREHIPHPSDLFGPAQSDDDTGALQQELLTDESAPVEAGQLQIVTEHPQHLLPSADDADATSCNIQPARAPQESENDSQALAGPTVSAGDAEIEPTKTARPLSAKQKLAAGLLASGAGVCEAAKLARVSRETVWRWTNHPEFQREVQHAIHCRMDDLTSTSRHLLRHAMVVAQHTLLHGQTSQSQFALNLLRAKRLWHTAGAMAFRSDG